MLSSPLLLLRTLFLIAASAACSTMADSARPNIVLILADDLGYGDLSDYGGSLPTPNIDALAKRGARCTQFYAASPVCTPTRASVLTGRYPLHWGITGIFSEANPSCLPPGATTVPQVLAPRGYTSAHVGKWHLGALLPRDFSNRRADRPGPLQHGFDHYLSMIEATEPRGRLVIQQRMYRDGARYLMRDERPAGLTDGHLTTIEADEALRFIDESAHAKRPFFLNLWFDVPHKPYEAAPEEFLAPLRGNLSGDKLLYASMLKHLDACVGRVVRRLDELGLTENTLVAFTSDNGPTGEGLSGRWRGGKGTLYEGGIRVPAIFVWPGKIPADQTISELLHTNDLLPTFAAAAGAELPAKSKFDGVNLLPRLLGGPLPQRSNLVFWQLDPIHTYQEEQSKRDGRPTNPWPTEAVRDGDWKLLARDGTPLALFNLASDPVETVDLRARHPAITSRLAAEISSWLAQPKNQKQP